MSPTFTERVHALVQKIPAGKVATYQQIATLAGNKKASRAVGMCMSKNTHPEIVPCHRVVSSNGKLTGYAFGGVMAKEKKLLEEGVSLQNHRVDLIHFQWQPDLEESN